MNDKPTILVVDDNPKNIQLVGSILEENRYDPIVTMDATKVIEILSVEKPDLILLDILMPVMDGFSVCKLLKSDPINRDIPIIFLTAKTQKEDILRGFEVGGVDYVTKPFYPPELLARIKTHIELQQAKVEITTLKGILSICASCKKIQDHRGYWNQLESYFEYHTEACFSHGMCSECSDKLYGNEDWYIKMKKIQGGKGACA